MESQLWKRQRGRIDATMVLRRCNTQISHHRPQSAASVPWQACQPRPSATRMVERERDPNMYNTGVRPRTMLVYADQHHTSARTSDTINTDRNGPRSGGHMKTTSESTRTTFHQPTPWGQLRHPTLYHRNGVAGGLHFPKRGSIRTPTPITSAHQRIVNGPGPLQTRTATKASLVTQPLTRVAVTQRGLR